VGKIDDILKSRQAPGIHIKTTFSPYFNHGLGKWIHKPSDVQENIKKLNDETGMDVVEMGNDDHPDDLKPERKPYPSLNEFD